MGAVCAGNKVFQHESETANLLPTKNVNGKSPPVQWQPIAKLQGSGQYEYQGFETWTPQEQEEWKQGLLESKWGVGQVSIRLPIRGGTQLLGLIYGYLPFLIPIWWALWMIASLIQNGRARFFPTYGLCIAIGFAIVNETITKQICKRTLDPSITARPPEAVCKHPGMPSGHVMNAYTLMTWVFLEDLFEQQVYPEWLVIVVLVMGPVPWARVYNKDHTVAQVMVSACVALVMGCIAFWIRWTYFPGHKDPWDWFHSEYSFDNAYGTPPPLTNLTAGSA